MNKNKKIAKRIATLAAAAAVVGSMALPASAADAFRYTKVNGTTAQFEKYLVMDEQANVPNVTFTFTAKPGAAIQSQSGRFEVLAGIGTPRVSDAVFAVGDTTYDSIQQSAIPNNSGAAVDDQVVGLDSGEKYARKEVTVDFSGIQYDEPGIYRYIITENNATNNKMGIRNDGQADRIMDVYVVDNGGALEIEGYVLHAAADNVAANTNMGSNGVDPDGKAKGYTNEYITHDLTVTNAVEGNQASKDKYFKFTVKIENAVKGTVYDVDISNAETGPTKNSATVYNSMNNPVRLTANSSGTLTQDFYLQHGQSIKIQGIADTTKYTVTETQEDYKASVTETVGTNKGSSQLTNVVSNRITDDTIDDFLNTRDGVIPTGVLMTVAPFAVVTLLGGIGATTIVMKKKREDGEA